MISLDLPPQTEGYIRDAARAATLASARAFGFGGDVWLVSRPSGVGPAPRTVGAIGRVRGLAFRQRPGQTGQAAGSTPVLADVWRAIFDDGQILDADLDPIGLDLLPGDVIESVADDDYQFGVGTLEPWYGDYKRCELERRR